jgi:glycosyltransferase involved in cell wall biosynthesis
MNILVDTSALDSGHAIRGIGTYTRLLVEYLEKRDDITVQRSGVENAGEFKTDLIHYPYFDLFFSTLPFIKNKPTVVTIHDVIPLKFPKYYRAGIKGKARFLKQKAALTGVKAIITDSEASKKDIVKHLSVPPQKVHVVYLAANPELKKTSDSDINRVRREYKLPKNYVLYVGDINYNKNIPQLIKAIRYLPKTIKLVAVGKNFQKQDIPEWQWIETQLALSDVEDRVTFIPSIQSIDTTDLAAIYSGAVCYVQPSLYEGFGLPVLEALQCKTPVVSTNTSSLPEVGGSHVIYTETDAMNIASGIEEVLNWSQNKREKIIREGYIWSQTFNWEKTAQETIAVYKKVLGI